MILTILFSVAASVAAVVILKKTGYCPCDCKCDTKVHIDGPVDINHDIEVKYYIQKSKATPTSKKKK